MPLPVLKSTETTVPGDCAESSIILSELGTEEGFTIAPFCTPIKLPVAGS